MTATPPMRPLHLGTRKGFFTLARNKNGAWEIIRSSFLGDHIPMLLPDATDDSQSWQRIRNDNPADFGFGVAVHPRDPETAWFLPGIKDEQRIPVDGKLVVTPTRDGGETFAQLHNGLPPEHAYDLVLRHAHEIDSSGEILAFGSTTGSLWVSENQGDDWTCVRFG